MIGSAAEQMIARPDRVSVRPNLGLPLMDPLSEVLRSVRLTGGVFLQAHFTAPWCVTANMDASDVTPFMAATPAQLIGYHVVLEGELLVSIGDEPPVKARAGEILLFPRNDGHLLASAPGVKAVSTGSLIQPGSDGLLRVAHGGGGAATRIVCGFLASEEGYNPLIAALPRVLTLDVREGTSRDWIEASVRFAASELAAGRLASSSVMSRLSETLLVEAVRQYASTLADEGGSWLNGINDPQVGRALALIHHNIGAPWSPESLAKEVAMSRSAFIDRFTTLVGMPPIRYLTVWRMQTAKLNLREQRIPIARLAHSVGYESEEAFSRAFKREFGMPPTHWRDQQPAG